MLSVDVVRVFVKEITEVLPFCNSDSENRFKIHQLKGHLCKFTSLSKSSSYCFPSSHFRSRLKGPVGNPFVYKKASFQALAGSKLSNSAYQNLSGQQGQTLPTSTK